MTPQEMVEARFPRAESVSLRDYFAAHAPEPPQWWSFLQREACGAERMAQEARWAYQWADAMLAERGKENGR